MKIILKKQAQKYLDRVDEATYKKLYKALAQLSQMKGDIIRLTGYNNRYRYKIDHYRIVFEWVKGTFVITVIEINTRMISMGRALTMEEIEKRFAEINAMPAEQPTPEEIAAMEQADREDPSESISLEEYKAKREYSGKLLVRIPKELHRALAQAAKENGVSINQYVLYKLAK